ncbi:hypothetical protein C8039_10175 [Halogeometricum sp. wsp3]|nr:hypothetical protein C8039_10175 [Halogeometricum sp. wsp3]
MTRTVELSTTVFCPSVSAAPSQAQLLTIIEDVLYMVTGDEYDLREALDLETPKSRGGSA